MIFQIKKTFQQGTGLSYIHCIYCMAFNESEASRLKALKKNWYYYNCRAGSKATNRGAG